MYLHVASNRPPWNPCGMMCHAIPTPTASAARSPPWLTDVLSRRAARAVATCSLGAWRTCPGTVFRDHSNPTADAWIKGHCAAPETNAEDLYVGTCVKEARNLTLVAQPCMVTLGRGVLHTSWASRRLGPQRDLLTDPGNATLSRAGRRAALDALARFQRRHEACACPITARGSSASRVMAGGPGGFSPAPPFSPRPPELRPSYTSP